MMSTLQTSKKAMRKAVATVLRSLTSSDIQAQCKGPLTHFYVYASNIATGFSISAHSVTQHVLSAPWFKNSRTVSCYLSMPSGELDTSSLVNAVLQAGSRSAVSICLTTLTDSGCNQLFFILIINKGKPCTFPRSTSPPMRGWIFSRSSTRTT